MDILDRLHHALRAALERGGPGARPPTIGDIYQHLIPYRAIRTELGVWELAVYEHALLRLLAGEGGHLTVLSPDAQAEFRRELDSPNPILGIYRDYPAVEVALGAAVAPPSPPRASPSPTPVPARPPAPTAPAAERAPAAAPSASASCHRCAAELPPVAGLRFCPACGADQLAAPCRECGSPLKPEWNFCVRCGTARGGGARPRSPG